MISQKFFISYMWSTKKVNIGTTSVPTVCKRFAEGLNTPCLSNPAEFISESSLVKMRPTKSVPGEKGLDYLPP